MPRATADYDAIQLISSTDGTIPEKGLRLWIDESNALSKERLEEIHRVNVQPLEGVDYSPIGSFTPIQLSIVFRCRGKPAHPGNAIGFP